MNYDKENHLKILKKALNFKKQKKDIFVENPKASSQLNFYEIQLYNHLFWIKKNDFVLLMQNYIENSIKLEEFETAFSLLWNNTMNELDDFWKSDKK